MAAPLIKAYGGEIPGDANELVPLDTSIVPTGRMGDRLDMAGTILYLVSRAGAYCNGNVMVVDGGRLGLFPSTY
jgi:NAD(P)-dependent dehydrogenase (short-subunit alcohol dehydrogenase family)